MLPNTIKTPAILALLAAPLAALPAAAAYDEGGNRAFMQEQFKRAEEAARSGRSTMSMFGVPQFMAAGQAPEAPFERFVRGGRPADRAGALRGHAPVEAFVGGSFTRGGRPGSRPPVAADASPTAVEPFASGRFTRGMRPATGSR
jgi:hypothetical protein